MRCLKDLKVEVANLVDLPIQTGKVLKLNGQEIALFRLSSGEVRAVENRCPHGGPLAEVIVSGEYVFSPLYDWKISLQDGQVQAPDTGCVTTYTVNVAENRVYIYI